MGYKKLKERLKTVLDLLPTSSDMYNDLTVSVEAMERLEEYEKLGSVEEIQRERERHEMKEALFSWPRYSYSCPECGKVLKWRARGCYCSRCGQRIKPMTKYANLDGVLEEKEV